MPVLVTCNIDKTPMSRKPDKSEYGRMRFRMKPHTIDAQRLFNGILMGHSFTPAALDGTGGDSWKEQRLFAVDIDNHPGETPLYVGEALSRMKERGVEPLFGYYTFSDTEEVPRFRIMIATDETVTDREQALKITQGFQSLFPVSVDKSAGDLARVFLGTDKGPCIGYTGKTNPVSHLLELYQQYRDRVEAEQTVISPTHNATSVSDSDLARAIEEFNMAEYISMSENLQGKSRNGEMMFNPCPICRHNDDFYANGNVWHCFGANNPSGIKGGNIINYLEARHGWTRERAREYFMYDVLKWDREVK